MTELLKTALVERTGPISRVPDRRTGPGKSERKIVTPEMQRVYEKGIGPLNPQEVAMRFASLQNQIRIGLQREGSPTRADGGLLAIHTGIPPITEEAWDKVVPGAKAFVADVAGTNWNIMRAIKQTSGGIELESIKSISYHGADRIVTLEQFISRIADPIAEHVTATQEEGAIDIGISLGFPHTSSKGENGIDATLVDVLPNGTLVKQWQVTDWDPEKGNITKALREQLLQRGINLGTLVAINDTPAVALDREARQNAAADVAVGFVGGTGTNAAFASKGGIINSEIGHAYWDPEPGQSDLVFDFMKANNLTTAPEVDLEHETGMYLPFRLAAGMEFLHQEDPSFQPDQALFQQLISTDPAKDEALISKIATGEMPSNEKTRQLAQAVLTRAGQVYGMALAAIAEATLGSEFPTSEVRYAFPVEGGTLLKGEGIKEQAEQTAKELGQLFTIIPAKGLKGVASLAMAYPYLVQ